MVYFAFLLATAAPVHSAFLNTIDRGWYNDSDGFHNPNITNYGVGYLDSVEYRNFLVFDLSSVSSSQLITSASLRLFNPVNSTLGTYAVYDVTTDITTLRAGGNGLFSSFIDLGTGISYGSVSIPNSFSNQFVTVTFNAVGVQALNAAKGGLFATGGTFTWPGSVFSSSGGREPNDGWTQLVFESTTVPEPATMTVFGLGAVVMGLNVRRKRPLTDRPN
jgi:hypothetical protein